MIRLRNRASGRWLPPPTRRPARPEGWGLCPASSPGPPAGDDSATTPSPTRHLRRGCAHNRSMLRRPQLRTTDPTTMLPRWTANDSGCLCSGSACALRPEAHVASTLPKRGVHHRSLLYVRLHWADAGPLQQWALQPRILSVLSAPPQSLRIVAMRKVPRRAGPSNPAK